MPESGDSEGLYIGLMSGTSMDGIDAALVSFGNHRCDVAATVKVDYSPDLRDALLNASRHPAECHVDRIGQLDTWVGETFRDATLSLLEQAGEAANRITAIGSHGQTLRHQPRASRPFTIQIGDPNVIAAGTGITTVADFRRRDLAIGGEGAPLAPAFHRWLFADDARVRAVLNIGGIANVTMLGGPEEPVTGFDTGPGNTLLDAWARANLGEPFDAGGRWAASGQINENLLTACLTDPYFEQPPPKSTGFEYFNGGWIRARINSMSEASPPAVDVQATLAEVSARTIATSILNCAPDIQDVLVCGGGIHNDDLMRRLQGYLSGVAIASTEDSGLHPDWVEAACFAWLAKRCLEGKPGNLPEVTGASRAEILGAIFPGRR